MDWDQSIHHVLQCRHHHHCRDWKALDAKTRSYFKDRQEGIKFQVNREAENRGESIPSKIPKNLTLGVGDRMNALDQVNLRVGHLLEDGVQSPFCLPYLFC